MKHLAKEYLYTLPSGSVVHPSRLINRDGCLMWKHAFQVEDCFTALPTTEAEEMHIVKTASRLEELNTWVSQSFEPWETLRVHHWFDPCLDNMAAGISVLFSHKQLASEEMYETLQDHVLPHETLQLVNNRLFFKRC
jgi:hypothetical protein